MTANLSRRLVASFSILAALLVVALVGCSSDKTTNPIPSGPKYLPSSTPENTLANLAKAYETRDSTGYDSLFDAGYTGTSYDPNTLAVINLTKADEARHIAKLAQTSTIGSVSFQYAPNVMRTRDNADPPGWATITLQNALLEISDGPTIYTTPAGEIEQFKFAPATPSAGSPTDTTWHIVGWTEVANGGPIP